MGAAGPIQYSDEPFRSSGHQLRRRRSRRNGRRANTARSCRFGTEVDLDWAGVSGSSIVAPTIFDSPVGLLFNATTDINWELTARARVGYAWDNILFYATGGLAVLGAKTSLSTLSGLTCGTFGIIGSGPGELNCSGTNKRLGGTVGAGIEYGFMPNWSAKIEYLYTAAAALEASRLNEVRVGVNYRFGGL
jgi:outer membrane immunogenic protein